MSLLKKLQEADQKVDDVLMHSTAPAYPNADRLAITHPGEGAVWTPAEEVEVSWSVKGEVSSPLNITLVRATGEALGELAFVTLATGIDPKQGRATVEVPDVPPGDSYAIGVSNDDPLTVYSERITITEPA
jgi:hypothetical protein